MGRNRQAAARHGRFAESLCAAVLRLKGYRVLARQWRCAQGELDIVARRGGTLVIVEVKARRALGDAAEALVARQRRRIARATVQFLADRPRLAALDLRFDVMLVVPFSLPRHLRGAWTP
jgi:putative endonuclease